MRLWDLDDELLFPRQTIVAYVKNLLHLAGSRAIVRGHASAGAGHHVLDAVSHDGQATQLIAPFVIGSHRRMYIPFVLQKTFGNPRDIRWSADGRRNVGCMRIAAQPEEDEFWLVTSRTAVIHYANSTKRALSRDEARTHPMQVRDFIERTLEDPVVEDQFRFANADGSMRIVPFLPLVLNHSIKPERTNAILALPDHTQKKAAARR